LHDEYRLEEAFKKLKKKIESVDGEFLIQKMISGIRELVVGMVREPQFGPCVILG
jgi:acyl-CoA synthetase (NDP forming)